MGKSIEAYPRAGKTHNTAPVWQYDYGQLIEQNMKNAKSAYHAQLSANYANTNPNRVMTTVTLEMANGEQILKESIGRLPATEPEEQGEQ